MLLPADDQTAQLQLSMIQLCPLMKNESYNKCTVKWPTEIVQHRQMYADSFRTQLVDKERLGQCRYRHSGDGKRCGSHLRGVLPLSCQISAVEQNNRLCPLPELLAFPILSSLRQKNRDIVLCYIVPQIYTYFKYHCLIIGVNEQPKIHILYFPEKSRFFPEK